MREMKEEELLREAQELEDQPPTPATRHKAQALADKIFTLIAEQEDQPIEQRQLLVRLAGAKWIREALADRGLLGVELDPALGRTVIKLRAFDDLQVVMHRTNDELTFGRPDAPLVRVFR